MDMAFANFDLKPKNFSAYGHGLCENDLVAICENDLMAICENDLKPKNFSAYGHGSIYYI